jgi:CheY-like chemotaxis protein
VLQCDLRVAHGVDGSEVPTCDVRSVEQLPPLPDRSSPPYHETATSYRPLLAENAHDGLRAFRQRSAEIAPVLSDVILPDGMTGVEVVTQLRRTRMPEASTR